MISCFGDRSQASSLRHISHMVCDTNNNNYATTLRTAAEERDRKLKLNRGRIETSPKMRAKIG